MGSCLDLREQMENPAVHDAFSMLISGKKGYKAVIERKTEVKKCPSCATFLKDEVKFCPECGTKVLQKS